MSDFDKRDFLDSVAKRAGERQSNIMPLLRAAQAVAPIMEKLTTGNAEWDRYLQYVQGYIEQAGKAKATAQAKIGGPEAGDPLVLAKLRVDIIVADAMTEAWTAAINLPHILVHGGEQATAEILRFNPLGGADGPAKQLEP